MLKIPRKDLEDSIDLILKVDDYCLDLGWTLVKNMHYQYWPDSVAWIVTVPVYNPTKEQVIFKQFTGYHLPSVLKEVFRVIKVANKDRRD